MRQALRARYRQSAADETTVFDGVESVLEELSGRLALVVATSKPKALAEPLLEALGLRSYFGAVVGPDLAAEHEEKAVTVGRALTALPTDGRVVMIGDREHDVRGAHANGLPCIGVGWGIGSEEELNDAGVDRIVGRPAELPDAVDEMLNE